MKKYDAYTCTKCEFRMDVPPENDVPLCGICLKPMFYAGETFRDPDYHEVNPINPKHYLNNSFECIDIAEDMSFNMGNSLKYIWRAGKKDPQKTVEDLKKAQWYVEREIKRLQNLVGKK